LERARKLKKELIKKDSGRKVLLHGDLHQENILSNGNDWVVIDPKGVVGDPIHEIWACVENPAHDLKFLATYSVIRCKTLLNGIMSVLFWLLVGKLKMASTLTVF
jgi:streptomycin 6-kinase